MAEGLFHDEALPARTPFVAAQQARLGEMVGDLRKLAWGRGEVEEEMVAQLLAAETGELEPKFFVSLGVGELALAVKQVFGKVLPDGWVDSLGSRVALDACLEFSAPGVIGLFPPGKANDAHRVWQLFSSEQMVERWNELAGGEISACPEDHNRTRLNLFASEVESAGQQFVQLIGMIHRQGQWTTARRISTLLGAELAVLRRGRDSF